MIELDVMNKLLLGAESTVHRNGWDQPAFLAVLEESRPGMISLQTLPIPIPNPHGAGLIHIGRLFAHDPELPTMLLRDYPTVQGLAFICEGWMANPKSTRTERNTFMRRYADMPGSIEVRMITVVDLHGRVFNIHRMRGEKPVITHEEGEVFGRVAEGLRLMLLATARHAPDGEDHVTALEKLVVLKSGEKP